MFPGLQENTQPLSQHRHPQRSRAQLTKSMEGERHWRHPHRPEAGRVGMPCGKHSSPRRAPQTVSAESSMEPLETDSLSEKQHQGDVPHCHDSTGQGSGTELHPRTQRTEFWPSLAVLILSPLFYRHSQVLSALPQCLKSRELVPSPNPRVTAQCYFPVTGTEQPHSLLLPTLSLTALVGVQAGKPIAAWSGNIDEKLSAGRFPGQLILCKGHRSGTSTPSQLFSLLPSPPPSSQPS